jgi:uncharacterized protein (TIGR02145 family)
MNKIKLTIILTLFTSLYTDIYGQIAIGSGKDPMKGALLDLKEYDNNNGGDTAGKGMMLPRVNLTNLKPTTPSDLAKSIGTTGEDWVLKAHIGLTVYNVNQCPAGKTIYDETGPQVWNGSRWQSLIAVPAIIEATPAQTSAPVNAWGTNVVRHAAKKNLAFQDAVTTPDEPENIYEEFYSADFGAAGRWMTTNLAAREYDGNNHSQSDGDDTNGESGRTLEALPNANSSNSYDKAYWCYPGPSGDGTSATAYTKYPHLGLLYTWDAATAGKGGANGLGNDTNEGASSAYARVQGICPSGWHLPSDYEWTELENAIIKTTSSYASMADISPDESAFLPQNNSSTGYRPSGGTHGQAMKEVCGVNATIPNGLSKNLSSNGFNGLLAGYAYGGSTSNFSGYAYFWSSSSRISGNAWYRYLFFNNAAVGRNNNLRNSLFSVRCKKDE